MRPLRGKVHNAIKRSTERCGGTHLQLQTKLKLQKTGDNTNITKLPNRILQQALKLDLPSTKRWQLKQKTASKLKRSPPQLAGPEKKTRKNWTTQYRKKITTDMVPEGIMMNEGVENTALHFDFRWAQALRLRSTVGPDRHYISSFNRKCKFP